jgi:hypothetical protein
MKRASLLMADTSRCLVFPGLGYKINDFLSCVALSFTTCNKQMSGSEH